MLLSQANIQANLFGSMMSPAEAAHFVKQEIIKEPPSLHHIPTSQAAPQPPTSQASPIHTVPPSASPKLEKMQTSETNSSNGETQAGNQQQ